MTAAELPLASFAFGDAPGAGGVIACVTTRVGGVSRAPYSSLNLGFHVGDDPAAVLENRRRVCVALGRDVAGLTVAQQVHGAEVAVVGPAERGRGGAAHADAVAGADALVTADPAVLLGVLVADCVPIVLLEPVRRVVAVVHAGWRGVVAGIAAATVARMVDRYGADPGEMWAGIGPSIGPASYEVGPEVAAAARARFEADPAEVLAPLPAGRGRFDLRAANRRLLLGCGLAPERIDTLAVDTARSTERFYSHRAEGPATGRFMALAALAP